MNRIETGSVIAAIISCCGLALAGEPAVRVETGVARAEITAEAINPGLPWPATDALGRNLPTDASSTGLRPNRCVGIFYFLTHTKKRDTLPNDIAKILAQDPDILSKPDSTLWGPPGSYYWGQPLYGYYDSTDPWVLRRHANLLVDAGIDTVIFDTTNRLTYKDVYLAICASWAQIRKEGGRTPQICFMVNTKAGEGAQEIYNDLYKPGLYPELWFRWKGRPLMICDPKEASPELAGFFTLRKAHWPFTLVDTDNAWHWETTYPQNYSYDGDPKTPEQVNVAVAQNLRDSDGKVTPMSQGNARGRSFHAGKKDTTPGAVDQGFNCAEQWQRALELDPPFVMVTGWNEWTARKLSRPGLPVVFIDQFDQEYSRDIEPVSGLHNDNYYYQLVANVRRYKGYPALPKPTGFTTIDMSKGFDQWRTVSPVFTDHAFDNDHRDFGLGELHYTNASGRNDLTLMRVACDADNLWFYAQTREGLSPRTDANWMWLLIDADHNPATGWQGYDFIVNHRMDGDGTWLERNTGGWQWEKVVKLQITVQGNELMIAVPRAALGDPHGAGAALDFKWWDNAQKPGDIMDVYLSGDAAPDGRFNYRYLLPTR